MDRIQLTFVEAKIINEQIKISYYVKKISYCIFMLVFIAVHVCPDRVIN